MRFHLSAAVLVTAFSLVYGLERAEFGLLFFAIGLVVALEAINTAVERLTDLVSPGFHPLAGMAKDIAAGAVLAGAVTAAVIGCLLFLQFPRLTDTLLLIVDQLAAAGFCGARCGGTLVHLFLPAPLTTYIILSLRKGYFHESYCYQIRVCRYRRQAQCREIFADERAAGRKNRDRFLQTPDHPYPYPWGADRRGYPSFAFWTRLVSTSRKPSCRDI